MLIIDFMCFAITLRARKALRVILRNLHSCDEFLYFLATMLKLYLWRAINRQPGSRARACRDGAHIILIFFTIVPNPRSDLTNGPTEATNDNNELVTRTTDTEQNATKKQHGEAHENNKPVVHTNVERAKSLLVSLQNREIQFTSKNIERASKTRARAKIPKS